MGLVRGGLSSLRYGEQPVKRLLFGYLWAYWFFPDDRPRGLFFTMIQHISRAGLDA